MRVEVEKAKVRSVDRWGSTTPYVYFEPHWGISLPEGAEVTVGEEITFLWPRRDDEAWNEASTWGKQPLAVVVRGEVYTYQQPPQDDRPDIALTR